MTNDNYTRSNQIRHQITTIPQHLKELYKQYRELNTITEIHLQKLSDNICKAFNINKIRVIFSGRQPHKCSGKRLKNKTMGVYTFCSITQNIQIYKLTAKRQQIVTPKTAIDTLLHEVNHHIDNMKYELKTIHCSGFYHRISQLKELLSK